MLRRTQPNQGLPLLKLGTLLIRQMTKPMVGRLIASSKEHPSMLRFFVALGRISMGSTGALQERARTEEKRAREQRDVEKKREEKKFRNEEMRTNLREAAVQDATRTVEHRLQASEAAWKEERELLRRQIELLMSRIESGDLGTIAREKVIVEGAATAQETHQESEGSSTPTSRQSVADSTPSTEEVCSKVKSSEAPQSEAEDKPATATKTTTPSTPTTHTKVSAKRAPHWTQVAGSGDLRARLHDRFYDTRVPDAALRDGGAELLADLVVYLVLATVLLYEYYQSKKSEQYKEDVQNARLRALEAKVNELVGAHGGEDGIGILERIPPARLPFSLFTWPVQTMKTWMGKPVAQQ